MIRRLSIFLSALAFLVIACGAPAAPALTDPKEILTKAVETVAAAKALHADLSLNGTVNADVMGTGSPSSFDLGSTTAAMDLDIAGKKAKITFSVPALFGLTGEVIQIGTTSYVKTTLTGAQYQKQESGSTVPEAATDPVKALQEFRTALDKPGVDPTKLEDAQCGQKSCYQVEIELTGDEISALASAPPDAQLSNTSMKILTAVEKDTLRPASVTVTVDAGEFGNVTFTLTMSKWDEAVTVSEPPADQIAPTP
jgi:hypothetical protein